MHCIIDGISHSGEGVARIDGKATFIPFAIPGEIVDIEVSEEKKNYQRARLVEVINASPDRLDPPCPYFYRCGGCAYQHVLYPRQLELKGQVVRESLKRIGGIDIMVNPVLGMENPWRYRNKVTWHTGIISGQLTMGFYRPNSRLLIGIEGCMLLSPEMDALSSYLKNNLEELGVPAGIEVNLRQSSVSGEIMLVFKGKGSSEIDFAKILNHQELASIYSLEGIKPQLHYGDASLPERIHEIDLEVSPLAFFQVNHLQSEKLIEIIKEYAQLQGNYTVLDAYCGTGNIALALAGSVLRVVGVENNKAACKNAKRNAYTNSISNCEFRAGDCEKIIPSLEQPFDIVILDPPRDGCKRELIENIIHKTPARVVYVSCNPATLARDLAIFVKVGYTVDGVQPIDMFPQTSHVETVVCLQRKHS